jgi:hypothetical protein
MDFSADSLRRKSSLILVRQEVTEIYKAIKGRILAAHNDGKCSIVFDLPDVFHIESMELKDIQLVVYSDIIEKLENDNFDVKIDIQPGGSQLLVSWPSTLDEDDRKRRTGIITRHLIRPKPPQKNTKYN